MEQWATLSNEVRQIISICIIVMMLGSWLMMKTMDKLDEKEQKRKEALRYEKENFTIN